MKMYKLLVVYLAAIVFLGFGVVEKTHGTNDQIVTQDHNATEEKNTLEAYICPRNEKGLLHGKSIHRYTSGDFFIGNFIEGKKEGWGTIVYNNGNVFVGNFVNDKMHGQGTLAQKDGNVCVKEFVKGKAQGKEKWIDVDNFIYVGDIANNTAQGKGVWLDTEYNEFYVGDIVNCEKHGNGRFVYGDGSVYVGSFVDDKPHGKGKMTYADGCAENRRKVEIIEKRGRMECCDISPEGACIEELAKGKGEKLKHIHEGNRIVRVVKGKVACFHESAYVGEFIKGKKHGNGKLTYTDGSVYVGDFVDDIPTGKGTLTRFGGRVCTEGKFALVYTK